MRFFSTHKFFILTALAVLAAAGTSPLYAGVAGQENEGLVYDISVSAGQEAGTPASATLTIAGESSKVSVEKQGSVTLTAGKSIILRPGTRVSAGGFLYASIEPASEAGQDKHHSARVVTVEEHQEILEQTALAFAHTRFSPFPSASRSHVSGEAGEQGSYTVAGSVPSAISPDHQRKVMTDNRAISTLFVPYSTSHQLACRPDPGIRPETRRVLRL